MAASFSPAQSPLGLTIFFQPFMEGTFWWFQPAGQLVQVKKGGAGLWGPRGSFRAVYVETGKATETYHLTHGRIEKLSQPEHYAPRGAIRDNS